MKRNTINIMFILAACIIAGCFVSSCDLFDTRSPEEPTGKRSSFVQPVEPELVIKNLANSIIELNADDYLKCLTDSAGGFRFAPSATAQSLYSSIFAQWDKDAESRYFNSVVTKSVKDVPPTVTFRNQVFQQATSDLSTCTADYEIALWHTISGVPKLYRGSFRVSIVKNSSSLWSITEWVDIQTNDTAAVAWSYMKALF